MKQQKRILKFGIKKKTELLSELAGRKTAIISRVKLLKVFRQASWEVIEKQAKGMKVTISKMFLKSAHSLPPHCKKNV